MARIRDSDAGRVDEFEAQVVLDQGAKLVRCRGLSFYRKEIPGAYNFGRFGTKYVTF